ncbi:unnamed protein product [Zymoseptoria tritici ST99CH_3D7]|uniref:Uncharacterized protein n=1 Tax=Zymoseptoria tritici (strain ST99CH_3D7) TaxID=1276538 RepID=A0A1X7S3Z2_ZYMT9|nr:unnamed protein product [Zymoseptoria tritici ST99CH_3D7]
MVQETLTLVASSSSSLTVSLLYLRSYLALRPFLRYLALKPFLHQASRKQNRSVTLSTTNNIKLQLCTLSGPSLSCLSPSSQRPIRFHIALAQSSANIPAIAAASVNVNSAARAIHTISRTAIVLATLNARGVISAIKAKHEVRAVRFFLRSGARGHSFTRL